MKKVKHLYDARLQINFSWKYELRTKNKKKRLLRTAQYSLERLWSNYCIYIFLVASWIKTNNGNNNIIDKYNDKTHCQTNDIDI